MPLIALQDRLGDVFGVPQRSLLAPRNEPPQRRPARPDRVLGVPRDAPSIRGEREVGGERQMRERIDASRSSAAAASATQSCECLSRWPLRGMGYCKPAAAKGVLVRLCRSALVPGCGFAVLFRYFSAKCLDLRHLVRISARYPHAPGMLLGGYLDAPSADFDAPSFRRRRISSVSTSTSPIRNGLPSRPRPS